MLYINMLIISDFEDTRKEEKDQHLEALRLNTVWDTVKTEIKSRVDSSVQCYLGPEI